MTTLTLERGRPRRERLSEWQRAIRNRVGGLTATEFAVALVLSLSLHANTRTLVAYPSVTTIARVAGLSVRTVQYALRGLEDKGWLRKERESKGGVPHLFVLAVPDGAAPASSMVQATTENGAAPAEELGANYPDGLWLAGPRAPRAGAPDDDEPDDPGLRSVLVEVGLTSSEAIAYVRRRWQQNEADVDAAFDKWQRKQETGRLDEPGSFVTILKQDFPENLGFPWADDGDWVPPEDDL